MKTHPRAEPTCVDTMSELTCAKRRKMKRSLSRPILSLSRPIRSLSRPYEVNRVRYGAYRESREESCALAKPMLRDTKPGGIERRLLKRTGEEGVTHEANRVDIKPIASRAKRVALSRSHEGPSEDY